MSFNKLILVTAVVFLSNPAAYAGVFTSGTPHDKFQGPHIYMEITTNAGRRGICVVTADTLWITNTNGSYGKDNAMPLFLSGKLKAEIAQALKEPIYRGRKQPGLTVLVSDGVDYSTLYDGNDGSTRGGPASSWLMNTANGLCASLK